MFCQGCLRAKLNAKQARRRHVKPEANAFGDIVTYCRPPHRTRCRWRGYRQRESGGSYQRPFLELDMLHPTGGKSADEAAQSIADFQGNKKKESIKLMYTDNALELIAAVSRLKLKHITSTPYRSTANSIAERSIRIVTEGTRTLREQSGFSVQWWPYASRCFRHSMNTAVVDGDSAHNKRHGVEFDIFFIPYGCVVGFRSPSVVLKKAAKLGTTSMPGISAGYNQHVRGKWAHDYLVCPLEDFQIENATHTCRIFRIREVILDFSRGYIFPLRAVKDHLTRTLGPHGDSTEVSIPRRCSMGGFICLLRCPKEQVWSRTCQIHRSLKTLVPELDVVEPTPHVLSISIHMFGESLLRHSVRRSLDMSLRKPRPHPADTRLNQVQSAPWFQYQLYVSDNSPIVTTVGGVHAKMRSRQTEQQPNNEETSDAVSCQKETAAERTIETITKPAIKKTGYVKRNIVEFCCGENSKIGQSKYQPDGCSVTRHTLEDEVTTNQGLYKAIEAATSDNCLLWASIPCTGGSPWQNTNAQKPGGPEKIKGTQNIVQQYMDLIQTCGKRISQTRRSHSHSMAKGL